MKLHYDELNDLYASLNIVIKWRRMKMDGVRSAYGGEERRIQGSGGET